MSSMYFVAKLFTTRTYLGLLEATAFGVSICWQWPKLRSRIHTMRELSGGIMDSSAILRVDIGFYKGTMLC